MKYTRSILLKTILLFAAAIAVIGTTNAQTITVTLPAGEMSVEESFRQIESQSGFRFTYSRKHLDDKRKVRFTNEAIPIEKALEQILSGSGFWYNVQGQYIIVKEGGQPATPRPVPSIPTSRAGEVYTSTSMDAHDNVNRHRQTTSPMIRIVDSIVIVKDEVRSQNTQTYTSYIVPVGSYTDNRLPRYALKTNLLYGAGTLTPNLGLEFGLGRRTSLELFAGVNPWKLQSKAGDNKKLAHVLARAEYRYWLCERMNGHFFGVDAFFTQYNVGGHDIPGMFEKEYRYDGIGIGGGITYGYFLPFNKRWGMEFNAGVGAMWMKYDRFSCEGCARSAEPGKKTYLGPTRAGITLVFNIK